MNFRDKVSAKSLREHLESEFGGLENLSWETEEWDRASDFVSLRVVCTNSQLPEGDRVRKLVFYADVEAEAASVAEQAGSYFVYPEDSQGREIKFEDLPYYKAFM